MSINILSKSTANTRFVARLLAEDVIRAKNPASHAFVISLTGELGSGKTSFVKGFAKGLGIRKKILSPTFVLMKRYVLKNARYLNLFHIDCYRVQKAEEIASLNWQQILGGRKNIVIVEWGDRVKKIMPHEYIEIQFKHSGRRERTIIMSIGKSKK